MTNYDSSILSLFPSSNNTMDSMFSDYASIKNGSYGKLLKAYYSMDSKGSSSSKASSTDIVDKLREEKMNPKVSKEVSEANSSLTSGIESLKSSTGALQKESTFEDTAGGQTATEKVTSALKDFVSNYNQTVSASKKSTLDASSNVASMMQATSDNASALKDIGITVKNDGTLSLNEKALKDVDVSKVKELFTSDDKMSYGSKILSRANNASHYSTTASTSGTSDSSKTKSADASTTKETTSSASGLRDDALELASAALFEKTTDKDGNPVYNTDKITSTAKSFIKNYNDTLTSAKNLSNSGVASNLSNIINRTSKSEDSLKEIGITVSSNGKLTLDEDKFKSAGMDKVQEAFKNYGSSVASSAKLVNYYTTTQASPANSYNTNGTYNTSAASSFMGAV